jgi:hypothetical protein
MPLVKYLFRIIQMKKSYVILFLMEYSVLKNYKIFKQKYNYFHWKIKVIHKFIKLLSK